MLSSRQLECFVAVADAGSFTAAADALDVSQPALSQQVRALEGVLGLPLFERVPAGARLTAAGRAMLPTARGALDLTAKAEAAARAVKDGTAGDLRVAVLYSVGFGLLPRVLRAWRRGHPGVQVRVLEFRNTADMADAMAAGAADVAIGSPHDWPGPVHPLGTEEVFVVLPDEPRTPRAVDLRAFADRPWVHYAPGHALAAIIDDACAMHGFRPRVAVRTEQSASAPMLAAAGIGPTLAPASVIPRELAGRAVRASPPVTRELAAFTRAGAEPLVAAFVEVLLRDARLVPSYLRDRLAD